MIPFILNSFFFFLLQWPTFFSDLLKIVASGDSWCVDLFLRVLMSIDSEVVDRYIVHTQEVCPKYFHSILHCYTVESICSKLIHRYLTRIYSILSNDRVFIPIQENSRNTLIKDHMRGHCVDHLVESWLQIMVSNHYTLTVQHTQYMFKSI